MDRITLVFWALIISWSGYLFLTFSMEKDEHAIVCGIFCLMAIYMFIYKTITCIMEDNPIKIKLNIKIPENGKVEDVSHISEDGETQKQ